jgi:signal transduction histidine kinase/ActR/RegA family two-component response regulator
MTRTMPGDQAAFLLRIARARSVRHLLPELCHLVEGHVPGSVAALRIVAAGGRTLRAAAAPSLPIDLVRALEGSSVGQDRPACGAAVAAREPVVVADVGTDPRAVECREQLLAQGLRAWWSWPLAAPDGAPIGTLALHLAEPREPVPGEVAVLEGAAVLATILLERDGDDRSAAAERAAAEHHAHDVDRSHARRLEAIGHLTGGIAHDLNNMLTAVLGSAELLETRLADEPNLRALATTTRLAAERGADLTRRLLTFARRQPSGARSVDIERRLADLAPLLRSTLGEQVDLVVSGPGLGTLARVDPGQFEQAILNLCLNARDAMPEGGRLTIEAREAELHDATALAAATASSATPGRYVVVSVSDTGTGMPLAVLEHAFDPFFTTKPKGAGTGLGLSLVYGFAQGSGGHVRAWSEEGVGTTVQLYLPAASEAASPDATTTEPASLGGPETILVVEDDDLLRSHVTEQLRSLGYEVVAAADGTSALRIVEQREDLALLFTDIVMPGGMNGHRLAEHAVQRRPGLPVLFTSGYAGRDDDAGVAVGGVRMLTKPYRREELAGAVRGLLDAQRAAD